MSVATASKKCYFFVDEAGDLTLFDKRGNVLVGSNQVSQCFMVGFVQVENPEYAHTELEKLRERLLADPYFKGVPSMQAEARKTALFFHAKDDLPEVRKEVFQLLPTLGVKVQVVLRRKIVLAEVAKESFKLTGRKLVVNTVYDDLVKRLFKNSLHKADENHIVFARRGKAPRYQALQEAIRKAKENFEFKWGKPSNKPTTIQSAYPPQFAGLQIIDYYLWALQRLYERSEERFFNLLAKDYRLIMDLDDSRNKEYGEWYSDSNPLRLKKIKPLTG